MSNGGSDGINDVVESQKKAVEELKTFFNADQVFQDKDTIQHYGKDWTHYFEVCASGVLFPRDAEQVRQLVLWARKYKWGLVPSGGRTGLSGAATATQGEWVVSFEKMNQILDWNPIDRVVKVQSGCTTEALQNFAKEKKVLYPIDFAAKGSSQLGGNIATNAGGIKVLRYGLTRDWVVGLKVVTGRGDILELNRGLIKNATGFDLRHLFIGSEGSLGFIIEAQLKLAESPAELQVLLLAVDNLESLMSVYQLFKSSMTLTAFEMFSQQCLDKVLTSKCMSSPFPSKYPFYAILEVESREDLLFHLFEQALEKSWVMDGCLSQSPQQSREFWSFREDISESITPLGPYKNDVSVRVSNIPEFVKDLDRVLLNHYPNWQVLWFGHIGDGNLHINILPPPSLKKEEFLKECRKVDPLVFAVVEKWGGSISAEHGVGLTKKPFLHYSRSMEELSLMRDIKKVFDPDGIMNPGKILE